MTPAAGAILTGVPTEIVVTLSEPVDPASVHDASVKLVRAGSDTLFGGPDDVEIAPAGLSVVGGTEIHVDLGGVVLPNDSYRITILGNAPINAGRVAWWRMDESSGTVVHDSSGNANQGSFGGNPQWQPTGGRIGGALSFDGVDDRVVVPKNASIEPAGAMTVCLWAKIPGPAAQFSDLLRKAGAFQPGYLLRWYQDDGRFWVRFDRSVNSQMFLSDNVTTAPYLNAWHHFAGTYDSATGVAGLYVDGVLRTSLTGQTGPLEHSDHLYLMFTPHSLQAPVAGLLDDVRIYSRALSLAELQSLASGASDVAVTTVAGAPLDGEFSGTLPSGNGSAGGHFQSTFVLNTGLPPAPGPLAAAPDLQGAVDLSWTDNSSNELGFKIERGSDGVTFAEIGTVGAGATSYHDPGPPGLSFYRVRGFNGSGAGPFSNVAAATPTGGLSVGGGCGLSGLEGFLVLALGGFLRGRRR